MSLYVKVGFSFIKFLEIGYILKKAFVLCLGCNVEGLTFFLVEHVKHVIKAANVWLKVNQC